MKKHTYREYHSLYDDPNGENAGAQEVITEEGEVLANGSEAE